MKIVLASYFQKELHGSGSKYGVSPDKPKDIECEFAYKYLSPDSQDYFDYHKLKSSNPEQAGKLFITSFKKKLNDFSIDLRGEMGKTGKSVEEILPFKDGDTLLSWERCGNVSYRPMIAKVLRDFGYEVIEN